MWREGFLYPAIPEKIGKVTVTGHAGDFFFSILPYFFEDAEESAEKNADEGREGWSNQAIKVVSLHCVR